MFDYVQSPQSQLRFNLHLQVQVRYSKSHPLEAAPSRRVSPIAIPSSVLTIVSIVLAIFVHQLRRRVSTALPLTNDPSSARPLPLPLLLLAEEGPDWEPPALGDAV